jgi:prevent-host-death family protein
MTQVGARELRHKLSEYLARVDAGERFEVTVSGRPVAQLTPLDHAPVTIARLIELGKATRPINPDTSSWPKRYPLTTGLSATEALLEERRSDPR